MNLVIAAIPHKAKLVLAYFAVYVIWGSTYFATSLVVKEVPRSTRRESVSRSPDGS